MKILNSFGSINPELADDKISINKKLNSLGSINPEHADDEISVNNKVNCLATAQRHTGVTHASSELQFKAVREGQVGQTGTTDLGTGVEGVNVRKREITVPGGPI